MRCQLGAGLRACRASVLPPDAHHQMVRVAVGGIVHETCTYADASSGPTGLTDFVQQHGQEILDAHLGAATSINGMVAAASERGWTVVPTFFAGTEPSGTVLYSAWEVLKAELLAGIAEAMAGGALDAVLLDLHGAGVLEGGEDLEADLGEAVRAIVGASVPLCCTLDLHGNISESMAESFELMLGCHLYPHTDMEARGVELVELTAQLLEGALREPVTHIEHLPMMLPPQPTEAPFPAHDMNELCFRMEGENEALVDITVFHGFHLADIANTAVHIVATARDGRRNLAQRCAREVGRWVWARRESFLTPLLSATEAVGDALELLQAERGGAEGSALPVVINEASDNCGAGAPGDATHLLRAMLAAALQLPPHSLAFSGMIDAVVAQQAHAAGVGATIAVELGGRTQPELTGAPLHVQAEVTSLSDGRLTLTHWAPGLNIDMGASAGLEIDGVDVVVCSHRGQTLDATLLQLHGMDPAAYRLVGLKSECHFRAGFTHLASTILTADDPGLSTARVEIFERTRCTTPLWPKDRAASYEFAEALAEPAEASRL